MNKLKFFVSELKPKGRLFTLFNIITFPIILLGIVLIIYRFLKGISVISNSSQTFPWGLLIGFNVITGVSLAGGGYVIAFIVYILGLVRYYPLVRPVILITLLGELFYGGALLVDLGRPWNIINPIIGNSFGVSSVLFLVAWCFFLCIVYLSVEFSPVFAEWLNFEKIRGFLIRLTPPVVIFGISLSILHQSALGGLFLLTPTKLHPLWYSNNITIFFFISSIFSGLSVIIIVAGIYYKDSFELIRGLGKACAIVMFVYLFLKVIDIAHSRNWQYLTTPMGYLYLVELLGFVFIPMVILTEGVRRKSLRLIKVASFITILGIILNRINTTMIAFKWYEPKHLPTFPEFVISGSIILIQIWAFRWIVNRMPVLREKKD